MVALGPSLGSRGRGLPQELAVPALRQHEG